MHSSILSRTDSSISLLIIRLNQREFVISCLWCGLCFQSIYLKVLNPYWQTGNTSILNLWWTGYFVTVKYINRRHNTPELRAEYNDCWCLTVLTYLLTAASKGIKTLRAKATKNCQSLHQTWLRISPLQSYLLMNPSTQHLLVKPTKTKMGPFSF